MSTNQMLLLGVGVLVVLLSVLLQKYRLVETPAKTRKVPVILGLVAAMICFFGPSLLRLLGGS